jgi:hypothetical protein
MSPTGAAVLDSAALAGVGPVPPQGHSIFLVRIVVDQPFTGWTDVNVLLSHVAKVLLPKRPSVFEFEVIGFGSVTVMPASSHARISSLLKWPRSATTGEGRALNAARSQDRPLRPP